MPAMDPACIRHTDLPGASKLFGDFCYSFSNVASFYKYDPGQAASLTSAAAQVAYPEDRRAAMVAVLAKQNAAQNSGATPKQKELLDRFAQPGTVAVVTGQQVGLFSGPAYTIYKALTAARLARQLTQQGTPAVPIFWIATEDHDFPEINHTWVFDEGRHPVKIGVEAASGWENCQRPAGNYPIEAEQGKSALKRLRDALGGFEHGREVAKLVTDAYAGTDAEPLTMGSGFRALLTRLLESIGILTLDPLDPAMRRIGVPFMAEALQAAPRLKSALTARSEELEKAGYHAQVLVEDKTSLFFLLEDGGQKRPQERKTLRMPDGEFASLADRAADASPNALLRPVWQDYLLPTVAYIGGPGEIAYFAQTSVLYDELAGGRMPVVFPRACFTLLDARAEKLLDRFAMKLPEALIREDLLKDRIAGTLIPETLTKRFEETAAGVGQQLDQLAADLESFDPTLSKAAERSRGKMLYQVEKLRRKAERETLRRDARATADAAYLTGLLYPEKHLQERLHSILPFLSLYGLDLIDRMYEQVRLDCPDHVVLSL